MGAVMNIDNSFMRNGFLRWRRSIAAASIFCLLAACGAHPVKSESTDYHGPRQERALEMWRARCQQSGEFIHRVVDGVDGVFLVNVRTALNLADQYELNDPYGRDLTDEGYIQTFLRGSYGYERKVPPPEGWPDYKGYSFVEAVDAKDGRLYRYTGRVEEPWQNDKSYLKGYLRFVVDKAPIASRTARYGIRFDDISTQQERDNWIAGSSLKVVDLKDGSVIAERVGYMVDWAQGSKAGGRSPWLFAADNACPDFDRDFPKSTWTLTHKNRNQPRQTQRFVEKVLRAQP